MRPSWWCAVLGTAIGIGCFGASTDRAASAEALTVAGSTTFNAQVMVPYTADIDAATGIKLNVIPNKSNEGLLALLAGQADLAMISTGLENEIELLRETKPALPYHLLRSFLVSRVRVAFPIHPDNPVRSVSMAKLQQILSGDIGNWRDLGGPDLPIRVVAVKEGGGVKRTVESSLMKGQRITPREPVVVEDAQQVVKAVAQDRGAMGLTQFAVVRRHRVPELRTNGLVEQNLFLVSLNEPTDAMQAVIAAARRAVFDEAP